jgi:hypothetical protein
LERKLRDAEQFPDAGGAYSTKAITRAIYGSLFAERLRCITEEGRPDCVKERDFETRIFARERVE